MMTKEQIDAGREILAELTKKIARDEFMEQIYQKQLLMANNKQAAQINLDNNQIGLKATRKLKVEIEEMLAENT